MTAKEIERKVAEMLPYTFHRKVCSIVPDLTTANMFVTGGRHGWNGVVRAPHVTTNGVRSVLHGTFSTRSQLPRVIRPISIEGCVIVMCYGK